MQHILLNDVLFINSIRVHTMLIIINRLTKLNSSPLKSSSPSILSGFNTHLKINIYGDFALQQT